MKKVRFWVSGSRGRLLVYHHRLVLEATMPVKNPLDPHGELELYSEVEFEGAGKVPLYVDPALLHIFPAGKHEGYGPRPRFGYCVWYEEDWVIQGPLPDVFGDLYVHEILYDVSSGEDWTVEKMVDVVRDEVLPLLEGAFEALGQGRLLDLDAAGAWVEERRILSGRMPRMRLAASIRSWEGYRTVSIIPYDGCCVMAWSLRKTGRYFREHLFSKEHLENVYSPEFAERLLLAMNRELVGRLS
jgi:hypothetical protein